MVNRQDALYSPGSPEIGRLLLAAEIVCDGTKLPLEPSRPKTTTDGRICSLQLFSIKRKWRRANRRAQPVSTITASFGASRRGDFVDPAGRAAIVLSRISPAGKSISRGSAVKFS